MQYIYVMVGLPGSGKSTLAKGVLEFQHSDFGVAVVSSDMVRKELTGDEGNQKHNEEVFKLYYDTFKGHLRAGRDVVLDATNINIKTRKQVFIQLNEYLKDTENYNLHNQSRQDFKVIACVLPTSFWECVRRDSLRKRSVGEAVIRKHMSNFQFPQKYEGFDEVFIDGYMNPNMGFHDQYTAQALLDKMSVFDQKNPHHKFYLLKHCMTLEALCMEDPIRKIAGLWHDVGKLFTQQIDEKGVAHYYGHDSVGTYFLLDNLNIFGLNDWDDIFEVLFYINFHMRAHKDLRNPKAEKKYRALFGDKRYEKLIDFANKDMIASGTFEEYKN